MAPNVPWHSLTAAQRVKWSPSSGGLRDTALLQAGVARGCVGESGRSLRELRGAPTALCPAALIPAPCNASAKQRTSENSTNPPQSAACCCRRVSSSRTERRRTSPPMTRAGVFFNAGPESAQIQWQFQVPEWKKY